jgi:hypothetical protein
MIRAKIAALLSAAILAVGLIAAVMSSAPASASASGKPPILINGRYYFQNVENALWLHASTDYQPVTDSSGTLQSWVTDDPHVVGGLTYVQVRLNGTSNGNWCLDFDSSNNANYLEPCDNGNAYQFYYMPDANGTAGQAWFRPYEMVSWYNTDDDTSAHKIYVEPGGRGNLAVWGYECLNC